MGKRYKQALHRNNNQTIYTFLMLELPFTEMEIKTALKQQELEV